MSTDNPATTTNTTSPVHPEDPIFHPVEKDGRQWCTLCVTNDTDRNEYYPYDFVTHYDNDAAVVHPIAMALNAHMRGRVTAVETEGKHYTVYACYAIPATANETVPEIRETSFRIANNPSLKRFMDLYYESDSHDTENMSNTMHPYGEEGPPDGEPSPDNAVRRAAQFTFRLDMLYGQVKGSYDAEDYTPPPAIVSAARRIRTERAATYGDPTLVSDNLPA